MLSTILFSLPVIIFTITMIYNIIITNDDARLRDVIFCIKFPWACDRISPTVVDNLDMHSQKGSPPLV
jgi:hypothetical protein